MIYVLEPPLLVLAFVLQIRAPGESPPRSDPLPGPYGMLLAGQAAALLALGAVLFAVPLEVTEIWPWQLTELTGRAIAAWLVALSGLLAAIAWEGDRSRIRIGTWTVVALVALQAVALARFGEEIDFSSASALIYIASLACLGATGIWGSRISTG